MLRVMVAEKRSIWRSREGTAPRMTARSSSNVGSRIRSASSSTRKRVFLNDLWMLGSMRMSSARRPGVATTTWGRCTRSMACCRWSRPPTTTSASRVIPAPRALNWSQIWNASSRVGVSTRAYTPKGSRASFWRIGITKAAVFPEPVWAHPMTSRPARVAGIVFTWTCGGAGGGEFPAGPGWGPWRAAAQGFQGAGALASELGRRLTGVGFVIARVRSTLSSHSETPRPRNVAASSSATPATSVPSSLPEDPAAFPVSALAGSSFASSFRLSLPSACSPPSLPGSPPSRDGFTAFLPVPACRAEESGDYRLLDGNKQKIVLQSG